MRRDEEQDFYQDDDEAMSFVPLNVLAPQLVQRTWPRDAVLVQKEG